MSADLEELVDTTISEFAFFDLDPSGIEKTHAEDPRYLRYLVGCLVALLR